MPWIFKHIRVLHDNAPDHTTAIVTAVLKKVIVIVLLCFTPLVFPTPCPMWLLFLSEIIPCWAKKKQSWQALGSAFYQGLITQSNQRPRRLQEIDTSLETTVLATGYTPRAWNEHLWANLKFWSLQIEISNIFRTSLLWPL